MLMMLALLGGDGSNGLQLMLMMLAFWGAMDKTVAADAHDAGLLGCDG